MSHASEEATGRQLYAIGLGSNRPWRRGLGPRMLLREALRALDRPPLQLRAASRIIASRPLGPARRRFANAAALVETALPPLALLDHLHRIEARFGRRRARRWGERTLDLDVLLWSGGIVAHRRLCVPHPALTLRRFVLDPLATIAAEWRHPLSGRSIAALAHGRRSARPIHR